MTVRIVWFFTLAVLVLACVRDQGDTGAATALDMGGAGQADRPWEVTSEQGESIVPNVFYADASENEQVMPLAIRGRYQIDRLIYPTLGNPNLYVKDDPNDSFMVVLRIEPAALSHLAPDTSEQVGQFHVLKLREDAANALSFYLVARPGRAASAERADAVPANAANVVAIRPTALLVQDAPADTPEAFKRRLTVRCIFRPSAMAQVPDGLYDLRFEAKKSGAIVDLGGDGGQVYEYQYNALRVFEHAAPNDEYTALNVTDTQVTVGSVYGDLAIPKLQDFVHEVNTSTDPAVVNARFITFNGDLHNGGSPGGFRERFVAINYNEEAKVILDALKELRLPIFLVVGNHDGFVSTGVVPKWVTTFDQLTFDSLQKVVGGSKPLAWPGFTWAAYDQYRKAVASTPGGFHRDVFTGGFTRREADTFSAGWKPVPREQRNMVLYDGLYQWQRTYGPLYTSFTFGKNRYVNLNTYDLRQHRRMGWGMYVVNYGGGMSDVQLAWARRELARGGDAGQDIVLLAHHDPRGGHKGADLGYYFAQLDYQGMGQSAFHYLLGDLTAPFVCKAPAWLVPNILDDDCLHDGLSDWMRPDEEFDVRNGKPVFSGYELVDALARSPNTRTFLLGHTHYNSLEVLTPGDEFVPGPEAIAKLSHDAASTLAGREIDNPVRGYSWSQKGKTPDPDGEYDPAALAPGTITSDNDRFFAELAGAAGTIQRSPLGHELVILRLVSNADMSKQSYKGQSDYGYSVLYVRRTSDARGYVLPQVNAVTFRANRAGHFQLEGNVTFDRTQSLKVSDPSNPVSKLFQGGPAVP